jgi:hypothetical protein
MYFQLLRGRYQDAKGKTYQAVTVRDKKGAITEQDLPVIESNSDLVKNFGPEKFRRLSQSEIDLLLPDTVREPEQQGPTAQPSGSPGSQQPPTDALGQDVTKRFFAAKKAGFNVFQNAEGLYFILNVQSNTLLNEGKPCRWSEVNSYIEKLAG